MVDYEYQEYLDDLVAKEAKAEPKAQAREATRDDAGAWIRAKPKAEPKAQAREATRDDAREATKVEAQAQPKPREVIAELKELVDEALKLRRDREAHREARADLLQTVREHRGRKSSVPDFRSRLPDERTSASQGGNRIKLEVGAPKTASAYSSSRHERPKSKKMKTSTDYSRSRQKKSKAFEQEDHEDQTAPKRREKEHRDDKKKNKKNLKRKRRDSSESYNS